MDISPKKTYEWRISTYENVSASLIIMEAQIKVTVKHHFKTTRMAIIKKTIKTVGKGVEKQEPSHSTGENVK